MSWMSLNRWLEGQFGLPRWLILLVIEPILIFLFVFLLREFVLAVVFRREKQPERRRVWRRASKYLAVVLGIIGVGIILRAHLWWLTDNKNIDAVVSTVVATAFLLFFLYLLRKAVRYIISRLDAWASASKGFQFQKVTIITPQHVRETAGVVLRIVRLAAVLVALYIYVPLLLSFFPATEGLAEKLIPYVTTPAIHLGKAVIGYLPNLVTLILIIVVVKYLLKLVRFLMSAIEKGDVTIPGFDREWAPPTYRLLRAVLILATIMIIYPYLPGAGSEIFKGFSIFIGVLVTLGSTSAINNIISGVVLTYTGALRVGDRVQIGDTLGDVMERRLFITRLRSVTQEEVTIPNGLVLGGHVVNLSAAARGNGLAIRISVGIGYDVDWRKVHEMMIKAALETERIKREPEPVVVETGLDSFAVTYTLRAFTDEPKMAWFTAGEMRQKILDAFNKEGVEIMTPAVASLRDGNKPAIPPEYKPKPFAIPGFQFFSPGKKD